VTVAHPDDPGVLLGAVGALQPGVADAVVSLCRLGTTQVPLDGVAPEDHLEVWLVDADDANNDLPFVLQDAADAIRQLRSEGKTVLLHCVHAHTRTPVVAALYGTLRTGDPNPHQPRPCTRRTTERQPTTIHRRNAAQPGGTITQTRPAPPTRRP